MILLYVPQNAVLTYTANCGIIVMKQKDKEGKTVDKERFALSKLKEKNNFTIKGIIKIVLVVLVLCLAVFGIYKISKSMPPEDVENVSADKPVIDVNYISQKLEKISSLETAKITYGCILGYKDGKYIIINKKSFSMYYTVTASAGIDVGKITVSEKDGKFTVVLPPATLNSIYIDPESFLFFDEKQGIFNKLDFDDMKEALKKAEQDVKTQATTDQLLDLANSNAVQVISNLLGSFLDEKDFEIKTTIENKAEKIEAPVSAEEAVEKYNGKADYKKLEELFKKSGFINVSTVPVEDLKIGFLTKEGAVHSVTIAENDSFAAGQNVFNADDEVIIKYHTKKSK